MGLGLIAGALILGAVALRPSGGAVDPEYGPILELTLGNASHLVWIDPDAIMGGDREGGLRWYSADLSQAEVEIIDQARGALPVRLVFARPANWDDLGRMVGGRDQVLLAVRERTPPEANFVSALPAVEGQFVRGDVEDKAELAALNRVIGESGLSPLLAAASYARATRALFADERAEPIGLEMVESIRRELGFEPVG